MPIGNVDLTQKNEMKQSHMVRRYEEKCEYGRKYSRHKKSPDGPTVARTYDPPASRLPESVVELAN